MTKKCSKCKLVKPILDFRVQKDRKNRSSLCKACRRIAEIRYDATRDREKRNAGSRKSYRKNATRYVLYSRKWRKLNPEKQKAQGVRRNASKKLNLNSRLVERLRARLRDALRWNYKSSPTLELLGCSIPDFKIYLESKFESGMDWSNYGKNGWHIDHIIPCAIFDLSKPDHQKRCFHFSNMQPLWAAENLSKSIKHDGQFNLL